MEIQALTENKVSAGRSAALGVAVADLDRVALGYCYRPTRHCHRVAPPCVPSVLDVEESSPRRSTGPSRSMSLP